MKNWKEKTKKITEIRVAFTEGRDLFNRKKPCPHTNRAMMLGWLSAKEMKDIFMKYMEEAQKLEAIDNVGDYEIYYNNNFCRYKPNRVYKNYLSDVWMDDRQLFTYLVNGWATDFIIGSHERVFDYVFTLACPLPNKKEEKHL